MSASVEKRMKKDREIVLELETQIKEIRHQLNEQLRCLDQRVEAHCYMVWELQDFYQRRAEVELEYARNLDKLVKQIMMRHRAEKQRREQWPAYSTYRMWQTLLDGTTKQSRSHNALAEVFSSVLTSKFTNLLDDMQRVYKKCRDMAVGTHTELTKVATELHSSVKTYHLYHEQSRQTQSKLERVQSERVRVEQESKKSLPTKRVQRYEKQTEKHQNKFSESNAKATKARNEYILSMVSANAAIRKFIVDDLPELINTMDYGYHVSLGQVTMACIAAEEFVCQTREGSLRNLASKAKELNQREDRQAFLQLYHKIFSLPRKFEFQPHKGDTECEVSAQKCVIDDLTERLNTITNRLHSLKLENEELWKTLETTDNALLERLMVGTDIEFMTVFEPPDKEQAKPTIESEKLKSERLETEQFYLNKLRDYQNNNILVARLQAKCNVIEKALVCYKGGQLRPMSVVPKRKRPLGKSALESRPKLFGGSIEEYVQATGQEIPAIITSCTRIINLYGMHHQGVFRVSGAQHEINDFKYQFERDLLLHGRTATHVALFSLLRCPQELEGWEEPLLGKVGSRDINSVAGVLKLYFRELQEPLFPVQLFDELIACSKVEVNVPEELRKCLLRLQELLLPLPRPVVVVTRYLFAFLNHLSEYSDENMMDPYNLAVCFGPTLLPVPSNRDQVRYQNYVNELVRILICYQEKIFPNDGGPVYERCIVEDDADLEDSLDSLLEDAGPEGTGSEDDLDTSEREAVVLYDFNPRNAKELPLKKGDVVMLRSRVSSDWWEGSTSDGHRGLVAHKFIALQLRPITDKQDSVVDGLDIRTSTESLPAVKMLNLAGSSVLSPVCDVEPLDRSVSQPNIFGEVALSVKVPPSPTVLASCSSTSSDLSRGGYASADSLGSMSSKEDLIAPSLMSEKDAKSSSDSVADLRKSERTSLTAEQDVRDRSPSLSTSLEPTPDLVLNLPTAASVPVAVRPLSPMLTTAEVFASAEHGTIKKNSIVDRTPSTTVDPTGATPDEVFPTTPREINEALDVNEFGFDLLPLPPTGRRSEPEGREEQQSVGVASNAVVDDGLGKTVCSQSVSVCVAARTDAVSEGMKKEDLVDNRDSSTVHEQEGVTVVCEIKSVPPDAEVSNCLPVLDTENSGQETDKKESFQPESSDIIPGACSADAGLTGADAQCQKVTAAESAPELEAEALGLQSVTTISKPVIADDGLHDNPAAPLGTIKVDNVALDQVSSVSVVDEQKGDTLLDQTPSRHHEHDHQPSVQASQEAPAIVPDLHVSVQPVEDLHSQIDSRTNERSVPPQQRHSNPFEPHPASTAVVQADQATDDVGPQTERRESLNSRPLPPPSPGPDSPPSVSQLVLSAHNVLSHSVFHEPLRSHRGTPSLQAHSAVLELLTKQHEMGEESLKVSSSEKSKSKPPPPVMKKPVKPRTPDINRQQ